MKRWAALTVLLYLMALFLLSAPVFLLAFGPLQNGNETSWFKLPFEMFREWSYWLWLAVMGAGQALLLLLPINLRERRLTPRRRLLVTVFTATFFLANLCAAGMFSALCFLSEGHAFNVFGFIGKLVCGNIEWNPAAKGVLNTTGISAGNDSLVMLSGSLTVIVGFWAVWALVFLRFLKSASPDALLQRTTRWLLRGSILELLVAVPSHIIVRRRGDCCAGIGTFWGITMGISVMLMCFGPGVFFLFVERFRRLRPPKSSAPDSVADEVN